MQGSAVGVCVRWVSWRMAKNRGRPVRLASFSIDKYPVTNRRCARFVALTGYRTEAERSE